MENIKPTQTTYSKYKAMESLVVFISGALWLCLVLMPWLLLAVLAHITGVVELSPLELKINTLALLGSVIQIILYNQK